MGKKKTRKKREVNKTAAVAELLASKKNASPKELAEALNAKGIDISAAYVSTIKTNLKKKKGRKAGRGRRSGGDEVSLATLVEAKKLAEKLGGVEVAKQALDALARLQ